MVIPDANELGVGEVFANDDGGEVLPEHPQAGAAEREEDDAADAAGEEGAAEADGVGLGGADVEELGAVAKLGGALGDAPDIQAEGGRAALALGHVVKDGDDAVV